MVEGKVFIVDMSEDSQRRLEEFRAEKGVD